MYLRIRRKPIDEWADTIWAAATRCGAPMVPSLPPQYLGMVNLSGPQLDEYAKRIDLAAMRDNSFRSRPPTGVLRRELSRCSTLIVLSTNIELLLASNRSAESYRLVENIYRRVAAHYASLSDEVSWAIGELCRLPEQELAKRS